MKLIRRVGFLFALGMICFYQGNTCGAEPEKEGGMRTIAKGAFSGVQEAGEMVITNKMQWEELWKKTSKKIPPDPAPEIDFEKESVLFASLGRKNTGGYGITIKNVERSGNSIVVHLEQKEPAKGAMTIQALTAPFHIVAVPKIEGKVVFETSKERPGKKDEKAPKGQAPN
jgi:hypothetical protein